MRNRHRQQIALAPGTAAAQQRDVDLTNGFRLDLKTMVLLGGLLFGWWNSTSETKALRGEIAARERERARVEEVQKEATANERALLRETLAELKKQNSLMALDLADLRLAVGVGPKTKE